MRSLFMLFLMAFGLSANAIQTQYILFNPDCMDRLEYGYTSSGTKYITYQVHTDKGLIDLEVGVESLKSYSVLPKGTVGCGNKIFDEKLVKSINKNLINVYFVMPTKNGKYHISPVRMASYLGKDLRYGKVVRPDYEFAYAGNETIGGGNLATDHSESQVFFMGDTQSKCQPYHFRSISKNTCRPMTEIYYLHGVGIIEEKVGSTIEEEEENRYILYKINGVSVDQYKAALCKGNRIQLAGAPKPVKKKPVKKKPVVKKEVVFVPKRCTAREKSNRHLVQYGESLFGIARREGVTVRQLRKWNHLKSTKILACSQLWVVDPAPKPKYVAKKRPKKKFTAKGVKKSAPRKKYVSKIKPKKSTTGTHIVQKGENLYMLATLYGYTVKRFAHMNGLKENAILKPGMELFTTDCSCPTTEPTKKHAAVDLRTKEVEFTSKGIDDKEMPVLSGTATSVPAERMVAAPKLTYHIVQEGETIWSIANSYGFETTQLMERNNLEPGEVLIPGMKIYLPKAKK